MLLVYPVYAMYLSKGPGSLSRESTSSETALVTSSSLLLIDLYMVDQPVDIREGFWVLSDELIAGWRLIAALIFPDVADRKSVV